MVTPNTQLQRTVIRHRVRAASAAEPYGSSASYHFPTAIRGADDAGGEPPIPTRRVSEETPIRRLRVEFVRFSQSGTSIFLN